MVKQAPTLGRLLTMAAFALSCFALLLFLWTTFGGPIPLAAQGYRFQADFKEATQLADNANVRISGVNVGRVVSSESVDGFTRTTIEIEPRYAPIPKDTKAILRLKTLLGETYVELTPGNKSAGLLPDGARIARSQVKPTVELDEVLRAFDPRTRRDLRRFLRGFAGTFEGQGENFNDAVGTTAVFAEDTQTLVKILNGQEAAVKRLVRDSGTVFGALGARQGELSGLVRAADRVLATTAARNRELAETVRILPTTLRELRPTLVELRGFANDAQPTITALRPAAGELAPALRDAVALAPDLEALFRGVNKVAAQARTSLPATTRTVDSAHTLFRRLEAPLRDAVPIVDFLGMYKQELVNSFANLAAATQGSEKVGGRDLKYLRALVPVNAEALVAADKRLPSNRHNAYLAPNGMDKLVGGLEALDCSNAGESPIPAPACKQQAPLEFRGRKRLYPKVDRDP
ncbi:MAG: MCE family protein [Thermoleophilaceae bacterium]|nr:MCE family protein [Thermoleophilaceae bacterium]